MARGNQRELSREKNAKNANDATRQDADAGRFPRRRRVASAGARNVLPQQRVFLVSGRTTVHRYTRESYADEESA